MRNLVNIIFSILLVIPGGEAFAQAASSASSGSDWSEPMQMPLQLQDPFREKGFFYGPNGRTMRSEHYDYMNFRQRGVMSNKWGNSICMRRIANGRAPEFMGEKPVGDADEWDFGPLQGALEPFAGVGPDLRYIDFAKRECGASDTASAESWPDGFDTCEEDVGWRRMGYYRLRFRGTSASNGGTITRTGEVAGVGGVPPDYILGSSGGYDARFWMHLFGNDTIDEDLINSMPGRFYYSGVNYRYPAAHCLNERSDFMGDKADPPYSHNDEAPHDPLLMGKRASNQAEPTGGIWYKDTGKEKTFGDCEFNDSSGEWEFAEGTGANRVVLCICDPGQYGCAVDDPFARFKDDPVPEDDVNPDIGDKYLYSRAYKASDPYFGNNPTPQINRKFSEMENEFGHLWCEFELPYRPHSDNSPPIPSSAAIGFPPTLPVMLYEEYLWDFPPAGSSVTSTTDWITTKLNDLGIPLPEEWGRMAIDEGAKEYAVPTSNVGLNFQAVERIRDTCQAFSARMLWKKEDPRKSKLANFFGYDNLCDKWRGLYDRLHDSIDGMEYRLERYNYEFLRSFLDCTGPVIDKPWACTKTEFKCRDDWSQCPDPWAETRWDGLTEVQPVCAIYVTFGSNSKPIMIPFINLPIPLVIPLMVPSTGNWCDCWQCKHSTRANDEWPLEEPDLERRQRMGQLDPGVPYYADEGCTLWGALCLRRGPNTYRLFPRRDPLSLGEVEELVQELAETTGNSIEAVKNAAESAFNSIHNSVNSAASNAGKAIADGMQGVFDDIQDAVDDFKSSPVNGKSSAMDNIMAHVTDMLDDLGEIADDLERDGSTASQSLKDDLAAIITQIENTMSTLVESIDAVMDMVDLALDVINNVLGAVNKLMAAACFLGQYDKCSGDFVHDAVNSINCCEPDFDNVKPTPLPKKRFWCSCNDDIIQTYRCNENWCTCQQNWVGTAGEEIDYCQKPKTLTKGLTAPFIGRGEFPEDFYLSPLPVFLMMFDYIAFLPNFANIQLEQEVMGTTYMVNFPVGAMHTNFPTIGAGSASIGLSGMPMTEDEMKDTAGCMIPYDPTDSGNLDFIQNFIAIPKECNPTNIYDRWLGCFHKARADANVVLEREVSTGITPSTAVYREAGPKQGWNLRWTSFEPNLLARLPINPVEVIEGTGGTDDYLPDGNDRYVPSDPEDDRSGTDFQYEGPLGDPASGDEGDTSYKHHELTYFSQVRSDNFPYMEAAAPYPLASQVYKRDAAGDPTGNDNPYELGSELEIAGRQAIAGTIRDEYGRRVRSARDRDETPSQRAMDGIVGARGCDIGGWYELMLYQARCIRLFKLNCLCEYTKTFIEGSAETYVLRRGGALFLTYRKDATTKTPQEVVLNWPLMWRGYVGPEYARKFGHFESKLWMRARGLPVADPADKRNESHSGEEIDSYDYKGLNCANPGDFIIWDEQLRNIDGSDARSRRHIAYIEKTSFAHPEGEPCEIIAKHSIPNIPGMGCDSLDICMDDCVHTADPDTCMDNCISADQTCAAINEVAAGLAAGSQDINPMVTVSEWNWGKNLDACGNTNRWKTKTVRNIHKFLASPSDKSKNQPARVNLDDEVANAPIDPIPEDPTGILNKNEPDLRKSSGQIIEYGICSDADMANCWEPNWERLKVYRSNKDYYPKANPYKSGGDTPDGLYGVDGIYSEGFYESHHRNRVDASGNAVDPTDIGNFSSDINDYLTLLNTSPRMLPEPPADPYYPKAPTVNDATDDQDPEKVRPICQAPRPVTFCRLAQESPPVICMELTSDETCSLEGGAPGETYTVVAQAPQNENDWRCGIMGSYEYTETLAALKLRVGLCEPPLELRHAVHPLSLQHTHLTKSGQKEKTKLLLGETIGDLLSWVGIGNSLGGINIPYIGLPEHAQRAVLEGPLPYWYPWNIATQMNTGNEPPPYQPECASSSTSTSSASSSSTSTSSGSAGCYEPAAAASSSSTSSSSSSSASSTGAIPPCGSSICRYPCQDVGCPASPNGGVAICESDGSCSYPGYDAAIGAVCENNCPNDDPATSLVAPECGTRVPQCRCSAFEAQYGNNIANQECNNGFSCGHSGHITEGGCGIGANSNVCHMYHEDGEGQGGSAGTWCPSGLKC